ncbi:methyltransferase family protein, partial [Bacteroidota bacterium]
MKEWRKYILSYIWSLLLVTQIVLVLGFGMVNNAGIDILMYSGWVIWVLSVIFGWLPILILKRKGGVPKGKSYVKTTLLVDTGLYSIIRHPQYTAGILFSLALVLISQNWLIIALGVAVIVLLYIDILMADKHEVEKYGDDYINY